MIDVDLLSVIRRWHHREGLPIREIKRRTGLSRITIRKYLARDIVEPKYPGVRTASDGSEAIVSMETAGSEAAGAYPITPSTSFVDAMNDYFPKLRKDPETGKATYAVVQAEDELAAIGMILGAGWAGARSMTATSPLCVVNACIAVS